MTKKLLKIFNNNNLEKSPTLAILLKLRNSLILLHNIDKITTKH